MWERIKNWRVTTDVQGSDHLLFQFLITISNVTIRKLRNFNQGDYNIFQKPMEEKMPYIPGNWSTQHSELEADEFVRDIKDALDWSHPLKKVWTTVCPFTVPLLSSCAPYLLDKSDPGKAKACPTWAKSIWGASAVSTYIISTYVIRYKNFMSLLLIVLNLQALLGLQIGAIGSHHPPQPVPGPMAGFDHVG